MSDSWDGSWPAMEQLQRLNASRTQRQALQRQQAARISANLDHESLMPMPEAASAMPSTATTPPQGPYEDGALPMTATQLVKSVRARVRAMLPENSR